MLPSYYNFLFHLKASEYNVTILDIEQEKRKA